MGTADARLRRRLHQLDEEVAAAWSRRLAADLTRRSRIATSGLAPRWIEAAARTGAGGIGTALGFLIGGALGNAPGAFIGATIGGLVGERLGSLLRLRRGQLARRRSALQESVTDALNAVRHDVDIDWDSCREALQQARARRASERTRSVELTASMARHASLVAQSALAGVASADRCLLRGLLRLEGRDRLANLVTTVKRRPGFASLVSVTDSAALREFMLWPPNRMLEQVRPIPGYKNATVFARAAYALDAGRRRAVLIPDGHGIRADIPEHVSVEYLAAEAALVSTVIGVRLRLRSATSASEATA